MGWDAVVEIAGTLRALRRGERATAAIWSLKSLGRKPCAHRRGETMPQASVAELLSGVSPSSSSSFFRGFARRCGPCGGQSSSRTLLAFGGVAWPRAAPLPLALSSSAVGGAGAAVQYPLFKNKEVIRVGRRGGMGDRIDVSADAASQHRGGAAAAEGRVFGASLQEDYDLSEPQKVSTTALSEWTGADVLQRLKKGFVKFKEERFL